jgi:hypothetical protein
MKKCFIILFLSILLPTIILGQSGKQPRPATLLELGEDPVVLSELPDRESAIQMLGVNLAIDQIQSIATHYMANFSQTDLAQSFIPSSEVCCGAGITLLGEIGGSGSVTIALWSGLPNAGGTQLASGTTYVTVDQENVNVDVTWPGVNVTPGVTYYLVFTSTYSFGITGSITNPYSNGQVYANAGYSPFPDYDYTFRTYSCDVAKVPLGNFAIYIVFFLISAFLIFRFKTVAV